MLLLAAVPMAPARTEDVNVQLAHPGPAAGFGAEATGGAGGDVHWVTTLADSGPGSLREGATRPGATWIRFRVSGDIELRTPLAIAADKTIDGRGAEITIRQHGLVIAAPNVILVNLTFGGLAPSRTEDAILIRSGATTVWIDHCTLTGAGDKLIGMPGAAAGVTISWSRFLAQEQAVQIGTDSTRDADRLTRVTLHHNLFDRVAYRSPRVSWGRVHAFNNYLRLWREHGMSAIRGAQLLSEANVFEAGDDKNAIVFRGGKREKDTSPGFVRSVGDLLLNGAQLRENEPERVFDPSEFYAATVDPASRVLEERIVAQAGWQPQPATPDLPGRPTPPGQAAPTTPFSAPPAPTLPAPIPGAPAPPAPAGRPHSRGDDPWPAAAVALGVLLVAGAALVRHARRDIR